MGGFVVGIILFILMAAAIIVTAIYLNLQEKDLIIVPSMTSSLLSSYSKLQYLLNENK